MKILQEIIGKVVYGNDEPKEIADTFKLKKWPFVGWPASHKYRVICDPNRGSHKLRLQAMFNDEWVEVKTYDDGYDGYGKLHAGKWVPLSSQCAWTQEGLERIAREVVGIKLEPKIVREIGA